MIDIIALATGIAAHRRIGSSESNITSQNKKLDETALSTLSMRQDIEKLFLIVEALAASRSKRTDSVRLLLEAAIRCATRIFPKIPWSLPIF